MAQDVVHGSESRKQLAYQVSERNGKIWHSLAEMYGPRWINDYGDSPPKMWCQLFDNLEDKHIAQAIAMLTKHPPSDRKGNTYLPSMPQFYQAARGASGRYLGVPETSQQRRLRLEHGKASPEIAERWIDKIRATMAGKNGDDPSDS